MKLLNLLPLCAAGSAFARPQHQQPLQGLQHAANAPAAPPEFWSDDTPRLLELAPGDAVWMKEGDKLRLMRVSRLLHSLERTFV